MRIKIKEFLENITHVPNSLEYKTNMDIGIEMFGKVFRIEKIELKYHTLIFSIQSLDGTMNAKGHLLTLTGHKDVNDVEFIIL